MYSRFDWRHDNLFTQTTSQTHDEKRRLMVRGYSGAENLTLENDIQSCVVKLLHLVRSRYAGQKKVMDLAQKTHFLTLDVISTIGFGKCFNLLSTDGDPDEYLKSTHDGLWLGNF
ncbi:hypothetical protein EV127DRAFT_446851 [Xylaria flabelliformis]|nr:hypothetical protein EV127DRAFT_446851 [Xylaria flabelliformis]